MGMLTAHRDGAVLTLTLSNPGRSNALDLQMLAELDARVTQVQADAGVRLVVLRGTAGGTFSSGADIRQWAPMSPEAFARDWIAHGNAIFRRFECLRCPTVAAIEGLCFGGGLELALCADLRVATPAARLRFPEVGIGAIPGWEGATRLERIAGRGRALELALTAEAIDADTASRWGVLNRVWPADEFEERLAAWTTHLASLSPRAAALTKAAVVRGEHPDTFYPAAAREIKASPDAEAGLQAFREKRAARF